MDSYKNISLYIPKAVGVKEYAYDEEINFPFRKAMEDSTDVYQS
jgi:protein phosphatase 2C family protein 2/3/protein phosphatase 1L